jgi:hypothetical protein
VQIHTDTIRQANYSPTGFIGQKNTLDEAKAALVKRYEEVKRRK